MRGNSFGQVFRVTTFGESHARGLGVVIDGCPPGLAVDAADIQRELDRRRPGQSALTSARREADAVDILCGVEDGLSLGTPIALVVYNEDARPQDYADMAALYRPGHADHTTEAKYGRRPRSGGGRASARETVGRVAAGALARRWLGQRGVSLLAWVESVGALRAEIDPERVEAEQVEATPVRCPAPAWAARFAEAIDQARRDGDSLGGVIGFCARGQPPGLGEPVFDKLEADLAKAMLSIPAARGFEIGSGFAGTALRGSEHNDPLEWRDGRVASRTNRAGGVLGGISTGEPIWGRVAFKPTATIRAPQATVDAAGQTATLSATGRHDPCVLPRAVPIVEAMLALVLTDHWMRQLALEAARGSA